MCVCDIWDPAIYIYTPTLPRPISIYTNILIPAYITFVYKLYGIDLAGNLCTCICHAHQWGMLYWCMWHWVVSHMIMSHVTHTHAFVEIKITRQEQPVSKCVTYNLSAGWQRCTGCRNLQVASCKRANNYRALLRRETYKDKLYYASLPLCSNLLSIRACIYIRA